MNSPQMKPTRTGDIGSPDTNPPVKSNPKTVEELMRPRYIVENLWPDSPYQVGEILVPDFEDRDKWVVEGYGLISPVLNDNPNKWPHIFRKLSWWQERKEEELPNYLRHRNGTIYKVFKYHMEFGCVDLSEDDEFPTSFAYLTPATESEYNDYIKSKKQTNG